MDLNRNDLAVIEQALREAINNGVDYQAMINYRNVLTKLQNIPTAESNLRVEAGAAPMDGFRYDYDDNAGPR